MSKSIEYTYNAIINSLWDSRKTMTLYFQLFCNDAETTALLNRAAGPAFAHIQRCIARDLLLSVARLCDPAETPVKGGKRDNCTFQRLIKVIESDGRPDLARTLKRRFEQVVKKRCAPLLDARHRRLAHNDHITMLRMMGGQDIIPGVSIRDLNKVIRPMRKLLAKVAASYQLHDFNDHDNFAEPRFGNEVAILGRDFRHLIHCLKEGIVPEALTLEELF
jgi:AbiU2